MGKLVEFPRGDRDAIKIGNLYRKAKESIVESVRFYIEAGQRLVAKKDALGHGNWLSWLEANVEVLGFGESAARKIMAMANQELATDLGFDGALELSRKMWGHNVRGTQGTGEEDWHTPVEYIEAARRAMGSIDLDPATSFVAQKTVRAAQFFTRRDDGLAKQWFGNVWLNPPYQQPDIEEFVRKLVSEVEAGHVLQAIMLTHNYTDTTWFHHGEARASRLCFTKGRIGFISADGEVAAPTQGQVFFYFGNRTAPFRQEFMRYGFIR